MIRRLDATFDFAAVFLGDFRLAGFFARHAFFAPFPDRFLAFFLVAMNAVYHRRGRTPET